jgi:hypothetical protein
VREREREHWKGLGWAPASSPAKSGLSFDKVSATARGGGSTKTAELDSNVVSGKL